MAPPREYQISPSDEYFLVARNADRGTQVLMGTQGTEVVCVFFTADGQFVQYETKNVSHSDTEDVIYTLMESWLQELGMSQEAIAGRLHAKSFTEHDFGEVRVAPAGDETFVCDSDLLGGFVF